MSTFRFHTTLLVAALMPSLAFGFCGAAGGENFGATELYLPSDVPDGCTYLYRHPFDADISKNHAQYSSIRPRDFVCFGDQVHINKPILTNGGDVFIFARDLFVTRKIDTRIYTNLLLFDAMQGSGGSIDGATGRHYLTKHVGFCVPGIKQEKLNHSYSYYYIVSPVSGFSVGPNYFTPRMPDGLVPASATFSLSRDIIIPSDGTDAPTKNRNNEDLAEVLKSGDITIFVDRIFGTETLPKGRHHSDEFTEICGAALPDVQTPALLHTQGLVGGRGGPGASSICIPGPSTGSKFSAGCFTHERYWFHTGTRGADSNGGMAGSIQVFSPNVGSAGQILPSNGVVPFNSSPGPRAFNSLTTEPNGHLAFRTPRPGNYIPPNLNHAATGSVCDFFPPLSDSSSGKLRRYGGPNLYTENSNKNPGVSRFFDAELLMEFLEDIVQLDAATNVDLEYFHQGLLNDGSPSRATPAYLLFQDLIAARIFEIIRWHEAIMLDMIDSVFISSDNPSSHALLPNYLNDLDVRNARRIVTSQYLRDALSALEGSQVDYDSPWIIGLYENADGGVPVDVLSLANYLYKLGGVGRDLRQDWEIVDRLGRIQAGHIIQESQTQDIRAFLSDIEDQVDQRNFLLKTADLVNKTKIIQEKIQGISALISKNSDASSDDNYLRNLASVGENAVQLAGTLFAIYSTGGATLATVAQLGTQAEDLGDSINKIGADSAASIANPELISNIHRLRMLISSINRDILFLKSQRNLYRNRILADKMQRANSALALRMHADAQLSAIGSTANLAIQASILDFLRLATRSKDRLTHNLGEIEKILGPDPLLSIPDFQLGSIQDLQCVSEKTPGCVSVAPSEHNRFVYHEFVGDEMEFKVPMYILPAGNEPVYVQSFGLKLDTWTY